MDAFNPVLCGRRYQAARGEVFRSGCVLRGPSSDTTTAKEENNRGPPIRIAPGRRKIEVDSQVALRRCLIHNYGFVADGMEISLDRLQGSRHDGDQPQERKDHSENAHDFLANLSSLMERS